jgi:hypothetical protein
LGRFTRLQSGSLLDAARAHERGVSWGPKGRLGSMVFLELGRPAPSRIALAQTSKQERAIGRSMIERLSRLHTGPASQAPAAFDPFAVGAGHCVLKVASFTGSILNRGACGLAPQIAPQGLGCVLGLPPWARSGPPFRPPNRLPSFPCASQARDNRRHGDDAPLILLTNSAFPQTHTRCLCSSGLAIPLRLSLQLGPMVVQQVAAVRASRERRHRRLRPPDNSRRKLPARDRVGE